MRTALNVEVILFPRFYSSTICDIPLERTKKKSSTAVGIASSVQIIEFIMTVRKEKCEVYALLSIFQRGRHPALLLCSEISRHINLS